MNLDMKIVQTGIYHYQTENMIVLEINLDEMKEEYLKPFYTESGWISVSDSDILKKAITVFYQISSRVNAIANKNHFTYPRYLCGSEKTLREFNSCFGENTLIFNLSGTYMLMQMKDIDMGRSLFLCNDVDHLKMLDDNCYGYYHRISQ